MKLFHYCCEHSAPGIEAAGKLIPSGIHKSMQLVWLTDLPHPDRDALGLTSQILACDRTQYRITVDTDDAAHWFKYRREVPAEIRDGLELAPGVQPGNWYVSATPIPVSGIEKL
jgi:hypothetical protein